MLFWPSFNISCRVMLYCSSIHRTSGVSNTPKRVRFVKVVIRSIRTNGEYSRRPVDYSSNASHYQDRLFCCFSLSYWGNKTVWWLVRLVQMVNTVDDPLTIRQIRLIIGTFVFCLFMLFKYQWEYVFELRGHFVSVNETFA